MGSSSSKITTKENEDNAKAIAVAAGIGLVAYCAYKLFGGSGSSNKRKKMKAPGRDYSIFRDDFEHDPASYFRDLRKIDVSNIDGLSGLKA
ncbi:hypothetical protein ACH5RR_035980 [Cinchona calisaya]|uniref:Uncharacterized protein n=1 Tax=Cinchona calisaya TaxID=153742 RepID=A0ABD2Y1V9_9GENT